MHMKTETIANPDLLRQKRAVHHALCTVLSEQEAENALSVWEENFSSSGSIFGGVNQFAREVCVTFDKSSRQRELVHAMNRALLTKDADLRPLPNENPNPAIETAPTAANGAIPTGEQAVTAEFQAFQLLLLLLLTEIDKSQPGLGADCREFLSNAVENLPWSPAQQEQVMNLLHRGSATQTRAHRPGQLKTLMRHLTAWMKEKLGSETALLIVRQAVSQIGKTDAGINYSLKQFF